MELCFCLNKENFSTFSENLLLCLYFLLVIFHIFYVLIQGTICCLFSILVSEYVICHFNTFHFVFSTYCCPSLQRQGIYGQENSHYVKREFNKNHNWPKKFNSSLKLRNISKSIVRRSQRVLSYNYIPYLLFRMIQQVEFCFCFS